MLRTTTTRNAVALVRCIGRHGTLLRMKSTQSKPPLQLHTASKTIGKLLTQFNDLSIYNAGTLRTTFSGFTRVASVLGFFYGTFLIAPIFVFDSLLSSYWAPLIVLGSAVPMAIIPVFAAPFVSTIRLRLPKEARKSMETVLRYARRLPPDTQVIFQTMRWFPWPMKNVVRFDQLRRVPEGTARSWNLVIEPTGVSKTKQREELEKSHWLMQFMKRMYSKLYVDRQQNVDLSSAPGVLDAIWEQIPFAGIEQEKAPGSVPEVKRQTITKPVLAPKPRSKLPPPPPKYTGR